MKSVCYLTLKRENLSQKIGGKTRLMPSQPYLKTGMRLIVHLSNYRGPDLYLTTCFRYEVSKEGYLYPPPPLNTSSSRFDLKIGLTFSLKFLEFYKVFEFK